MASRGRLNALRVIHRDEGGLEAVEWVLLLAAFVVPMIALMLEIVGWLGYFYSITSWVVSLPF